MSGIEIVETLDIGWMNMVLIHLSAPQESYKDSLAYVITTSGTTGQPKIVRVPHSCILPNITHIRFIHFFTFYFKKIIFERILCVCFLTFMSELF